MELPWLPATWLQDCTSRGSSSWPRDTCWHPHSWAFRLRPLCGPESAGPHRDGEAGQAACGRESNDQRDTVCCPCILWLGRVHSS